MGFRFRKSIKIAPGIRLNFNKKSTSITMGTKGAHHTINSSGTETTSIGLPGTGLSYTSYSNKNIKSSEGAKNDIPTTLSEKIESKCLIYRKIANVFLCIAIIFAILSLFWLWFILLSIGPLITYFVLLCVYYDSYTKKAEKIIEQKILGGHTND